MRSCPCSERSSAPLKLSHTLRHCRQSVAPPPPCGFLLCDVTTKRSLPLQITLSTLGFCDRPRRVATAARVRRFPPPPPAAAASSVCRGPEERMSKSLGASAATFSTICRGVRKPSSQDQMRAVPSFSADVSSRSPAFDHATSVTALRCPLSRATRLASANSSAAFRSYGSSSAGAGGCAAPPSAAGAAAVPAPAAPSAAAAASAAGGGEGAAPGGCGCCCGCCCCDCCCAACCAACCLEGSPMVKSASSSTMKTPRLVSEEASSTTVCSSSDAWRSLGTAPTAAPPAAPLARCGATPPTPRRPHQSSRTLLLRRRARLLRRGAPLPPSASSSLHATPSSTISSSLATAASSAAPPSCSSCSSGSSGSSGAAAPPLSASSSSLEMSVLCRSLLLSRAAAAAAAAAAASSLSLRRRRAAAGDVTTPPTSRAAPEGRCSVVGMAGSGCVVLGRLASGRNQAGRGVVSATGCAPRRAAEEKSGRRQTRATPSSPPVTTWPPTGQTDTQRTLMALREPGFRCGSTR